MENDSGRPHLLRHRFQTCATLDNLESPSRVKKLIRSGMPHGLTLSLLENVWMNRRMWFHVTGDVPACLSSYKLRTIVMIWVLAICSAVTYAQTPTEAPSSDKQTASQSGPSQLGKFSSPPVDLKSLPKNLFIDQKN